MASQKRMKNNSAKIYVGTTGFKKIKKKLDIIANYSCSYMYYINQI